MDYPTIVLLIGAVLMMLVILVLAASILSARSFTQLAELIRYLGSLVERQHQETRQAQITLSKEVENKIDSAITPDTPIMPDNHG